jgi:ubiquinone/menaquinone biosynthesis C-methylase UbiE
MRIIIEDLKKKIIPPSNPTINTTPKLKLNIKSMNLPIVPTSTDSVVIPAPSPPESNESTITKQARQKSKMSVLHQQYKTLKSTNLQQLFKDKPQLFYDYHDLSEANELSFPTDEIPRNRIIQKLESIKVAKNKSKTVVDMGCGKAHIAEHFKNDARYTFINYDHVSSRNDIEKCDISQTPLDDNEVEIAVLCLALWGSNCRDYITETHRILETGGRLYVVEATRRWSVTDESNNIVAGQEGGKLRTLLEEAGFQILDADIRKFSQFVCVKT